jgi:hypothetical protein
VRSVCVVHTKHEGKVHRSLLSLQGSARASPKTKLRGLLPRKQGPHEDHPKDTISRLYTHLSQHLLAFFATMLHRLVALLRVLLNADGAEPSAMLIPGGSRKRELAAARHVKCLSTVQVVLVSSGAVAQFELQDAVHAAGSSAMCIADRSAVDTVTNFTTTCCPLASAGVRCAAVCTSRSHYARATFVATIILGACGIRVVPLCVCSEDGAPESRLRLIRDGIRSVCWLLTGVDGSCLAQLVHPHRVEDARDWRGEGGRVALAPALHQALAG